MLKKIFSSLFFFALISIGMSQAYASDDGFQPAYQNEGNYAVDEYHSGINETAKYITRDGGRLYYTSGKKNGFRVNENNEESTDETIGILTFVFVPATLVYMNIIGWWE